MQSKRLLLAAFVFCTFVVIAVPSAQSQTDVTGYLQAEWQHYDQSTNPNGRAFYSNSPKNLFLIRRGRIKLTHKDEGFKAVVEGDFTERGVNVRDAYLSTDILDDNLLNLTVGLFKRPNSSVELSSSKREATERSQVIRAFYPGERDLGFKLTSTPEISEDIKPTIQLALFNGTQQETDPLKDIITRVTLPLPLGKDSKVNATIGGTFYFGGIPQPDDSIFTFEDGQQNLIYEDASSSMSGMGNRQHIGVEAQVEADIFGFGTTTVRGEFLTGQRPEATTRISGGITDPAVIPTVRLRNQMGYFATLVQGLGKKYQAAFRYDFFDRNTDVEGTQILSGADRSSSVIGFGLLGTFGPIRITAWYEIPTFGTDEAQFIDGGGTLKSDDLKDNKTTVRFQYILK